MSTLFTPTTEFLDVVDGLEPVTLVPRDGGSETAIAGAKRRAVSLQEAEASGGRYTRADVVWHIAASQLDSPPSLGDRIVDGAGENWTVLDVARAARDTRWACHARNLAVAAGLDTVVRIQQAAWSKDRHGAAMATWSDLRLVQARIQPLALRPALEHDAQSARATHRIVLAEQVAVTENMRVVAADATVYAIESYEQAERIDTLPAINVVKVEAT